uniref:RING-type domain-containing protein n=1 Tax=Leptobrachium leishanense TaxID=445787 RepID=A0A8C5N4Z5_9ANUR
MASVNLKAEVTCPLCKDIYTDPVTLTCGHSYCRLCITKTWDNQEEGESSCPECRYRFRERSELKRNLRLCNIAEIPAVRTCLLCEASMCENHLGAEKRVQNLVERRRKVQEKAAGVTERVTALIRDIKERLEDLEKRVLSEISRQEEQVSSQLSDLIWHLEVEKQKLSRKIGDIEELCDMTDPLTVLQRTGIRQRRLL